MNQSTNRKCLALVASFAFLAVAGTVGAQQSLDIVGTANVQGTGAASFSVEMTTTAPVEGYVLAISYDNTAVTVTDVNATGSAAEMNGAELIVPEILATGFTLGVVMDAAPPFDGQTIPAGMGLNICNFTAQSILILPQGDPTVVTGFDFTDGVLNNPPLDNIIVQGGLSVGGPQGLALNGNPSAMSIDPPPPAGLTIESASFPSTDGGCVRILLDNDAGATQGFVLSISHDAAALTLTDINLTGTATEAAGAEFVAVNTLASGGTIGVVLDFNAPFDGQTIAAGQNIHIANYCYTCNNPILVPDDGVTPIPPTQMTDLTFVDGVFGTPPLDNVVVVGGLSINPNLNNGTFGCEPVLVPVEDTEFFCGGPAGPGDVEGTAGETVDVCFYYSDPTDNLQGLQLAVCFDCDLTFNDFDVTGSIFDEVGAEFVNWNIDNDPNDGDGCEMVVGILLDALPPFDGQTVPPTSTPLLIGCSSVTISPTAACNTCLPVTFCNGINGAGNVMIENIAIIDFQSIQSFGLNDCNVCVVPEPVFQRGDCNDDDKVDLADAAKILGWQFQGEPINCPDACDANDDGKINLADAVLLMNYLFKFGDAPADPGPDMDGPDGTGDDLPECTNGTAC